MAADEIHETVDLGTGCIVCQAERITVMPNLALYRNDSQCTLVESFNKNIQAKDLSHEKTRYIAVGFKFNLPG
jgi:hypothetical protein